MALLVVFVAWAYKAIRPPPPRNCGSPGGPAVTGPRIKLRDGRQLAYSDYGVPKQRAKYNIILIHGFGASRLDDAFRHSVFNLLHRKTPFELYKLLFILSFLVFCQELVQELGLHIVSFDRPGYGESDPDPRRSVKSVALDVEELGDQLDFGPKFYVIGCSMGGQLVWGCLKYIPHR